LFSRAELFAVLMAGGFLFLAGCVTTHMAPLVEDHTIGLISRPITGPAELAWRVKTVSGETLDRMEIQLIDMPRLEAQPIPPVASQRPRMDPEVMRKWLTAEAGQSVKGSLSLLINGNAYFSRLDEVLRQATNRIDVQTYIFDNDDVAQAVADVLRAQSQRIPVRVLLDGIGSRTAWDVQASSAATVSPPDIPNMISYLKRDSRVKVRRGYNLWFSTDHSKLIVVDESTAFFGGMNIGREYRYDWRDLMVEIEGPLVDEFQHLFDRAWNRAKTFSDLWILFDKHRRKKIHPEGIGVECYLLLTTPFTKDIFNAHLRAARSAQHHVYVENPYVWNTKFIYALCEARKRGVDVRVTVPMRGNIDIGNGATRMAVNTLLSHGVRVFLYPGMTHLKAAIYDGWASFGTANFDDLSLHKNIEINLFTETPEFVKDFENCILLDGQDRSLEVDRILPTTFWDEVDKGMADFM